MTYKCFPVSFNLLKSIIQYLVDDFCLIIEKINKIISILD
jgi:hypothetical protein